MKVNGALGLPALMVASAIAATRPAAPSPMDVAEADADASPNPSPSDSVVTQHTFALASPMDGEVLAAHVELGGVVHGQYSGGTVDATTGTTTVRCSVDDPRRLQSGMSVELTLG